MIQGEECKCSICLNNIEEKEQYIIPECKHKFHTNCIMTWFRMGHNKCPLCNNPGINGFKSNLIPSILTMTEYVHSYSWAYRQNVLLNNYKKMRRLSKKDCASIHLKKSVKKLEKEEKKLENLSAHIKEFLKSTPNNLSVKEIIKKNSKLKNKKWKIKCNILNIKSYIGMQFQNYNIIIPKIETI